MRHCEPFTSQFHVEHPRASVIAKPGIAAATTIHLELPQARLRVTQVIKLIWQQWRGSA